MKIDSLKLNFAVCLLALPLACGCGDAGFAKVSGTVTMDGQPLDKAIVTFSPQEGGPSGIGRTDAQGHYELFRRGEPGAPIGAHKVMVTSVQEGIQTESAAPAAEAGSDSDAYMKQAMGRSSDYNSASFKEKIPAKYNAQTTLTKTVESGENVIDLELTSK